jgi:hypothetical protein
MKPLVVGGRRPLVVWWSAVSMGDFISKSRHQSHRGLGIREVRQYFPRGGSRTGRGKMGSMEEGIWEVRKEKAK